LYLVWSGWEKKREHVETAHIYIATLNNPYTVGSKRVRLSSPELPWERNWQAPDSIQPKYPIFVNEGPQVLSHGEKLFLVYSASGCWTDTYTLGMLSAGADRDLLRPASWKKSRQPVFGQSAADSVYATGHNSFFKSPDGTEDWLLYHANSEPNQGCTIYRSPRAQKIIWNQDGTPNFGKPVAAGVPLPVPAGKHQQVDGK
jgi:GH43 family beta-xylosidase